VAYEELLQGALSSTELVSSVCRMPGVPRAVADELATALLGGLPEFRMSEDGVWSLATATNGFHCSDPGPDTPLEQLRCVVVDVETTGLSTLGGDRITEIAAYGVEGGSIVPLIDTLINPRRYISRQVTALTGITWEMVRDAPPFQNIAADMLAALQGRVFVAHNVSFDWRFVAHELTMATSSPPGAVRLCTARLARALLPALRRRSLDHLAGYFGFEIAGRHRAGGDAHATAKILVRMMDIAMENGIRTVGQLDALVRTMGARGRRVARKRRAATGRRGGRGKKGRER
jgi:DNA polymerase-3 subunit epsilon